MDAMKTASAVIERMEQPKLPAFISNKDVAGMVNRKPMKWVRELIGSFSRNGTYCFRKTVIRYLLFLKTRYRLFNNRLTSFNITVIQ